MRSVCHVCPYYQTHSDSNVLSQCTEIKIALTTSSGSAHRIHKLFALLACFSFVEFDLAAFAWRSGSLELKVTLENLLHVYHALLLAGRRSYGVQCVWRLNENRIVNDDLVVGPSCRKPVVMQSVPKLHSDAHLESTYVLAR